MVPSSQDARASIIIVTYGHRQVTERCLNSLRECLGDGLGAEWELVLVDNASPDDTPALLRSWSDRATVRLLPENRNFSGGCNVGAAEARGEVLVFLNNDTVVTPGALETIVEQALEPGVAAASCRLLYPHGAVQHAGVAFAHGETLGRAVMPQLVFYGQDEEFPAARTCYEVDAAVAAALAVRASTFSAIGGFDEAYRNGCEDSDLCLRIRLTGERIVYRGDATIIHHEGTSRGSGADAWATPERAAAMQHNEVRFISRWGAHLEQDDEMAATLWDAELTAGAPARHVRTADIVLAGQPGGIGPAADEARALLAGLAAGGYTPAAVDLPQPIVVPRLSDQIARLTAEAQRRLPAPGARYLFLPNGARDASPFEGPAIVRLARAETNVALEHAAAVWASCPAVASTLVQDGLPASKVIVVAPPVLPVGQGDGGDGVLAILPVHDAARTRALLEALHELPAGVPIRLLPNVLTRNLDRQIAGVLPRAELLGPCSDELRFAALAATADVVIAGDPSDYFERRALVAAGVGTAPITCAPAGPASAVLGNAVFAELGALGPAVTRVLSEPGGRSERARRVRRACAPEALAAHLEPGLRAA